MKDIKELQYKQSRSLSEKIEMSQCLIEQWWKHWEEKVYISFSGGKDSTVLLHLVRSIFPDVIAVFSDTGLEYPEIKQQVKSFSNVKIIRPKKSYRQVVDHYGYAVVSKEQSSFIQEYRDSKSEKLKEYRLNGNKSGRGKISKKWKYLIDAPFKISDKCCDVLKKEPFTQYEKETGQKAYLGILAQESDMRVQRWLRFGCNAFDTKRPFSTPLVFWSEQDILEYHLLNNLPLASVYGTIERNYDGKLSLTGVQSTGCVWCMFGAHLEKEPNRFQQLKNTHPKIYEYAMNDMGLGDVLDYVGVKKE